MTPVSRLFLFFTFAACSFEWPHLHYESRRKQGHNLHSADVYYCTENVTLQPSSIFLVSSLLLALKFISYLLHKLVLHISISFLYSRSIPNHSNCFLLSPFLSLRRLRSAAANDFVLQLDGESKIRMGEYIVTKLKFHATISPPATAAS